MTLIIDKTEGRLGVLKAHAKALDETFWAENGNRVCQLIDQYEGMDPKHKFNEKAFDEFLFNNLTPNIDRLLWQLGFNQWGNDYEVHLWTDRGYGTEETLNLYFEIYKRGVLIKPGEFVMNGGLIYSEQEKRWGTHT